LTPAVELAIVLVAAGASTRMGFDKLWTDAGGQPLVAHALTAARQVDPDELVFVVAPERLAEASELAPQAHVVAGGARRRDSVANGLAACRAEWVAVHDAARALAPPDLFSRGVQAASATGAAVPILPIVDTIKHVVDGRVQGTLNRAEYALVQTPQVFRRDLLTQALASSDRDVTDEATLVEQLGVAVATFPGDERAFKVTRPLDLLLVRTLLR
jgi:2-C-methyl-D-erythritol 4-phosphate cytidylyltransferase/2-C-methyl-D-erythritol 2,4-cyclodiphosphate synthase